MLATTLAALPFASAPALAQEAPGPITGVDDLERVDERYLAVLRDIAASASGRAFLDALLLIDREYLYPTDRDELLRGATAGLIEALGDPYSRYFDPAAVESRRTTATPDAGVVKATLGDVGYLGVPSFEGDDVGGALARALDAHLANGARGVVLDLRGNAGGSILQGLQVLDRFISDGVLGFRRVRGVSVPIAYANPRSVAQPLVVLVDERTASTAEIVAGALQAYGRAQLVGTVTAGKGIGQSSIELSDGAEVQLVSFEWLLPGFRSIDGSGLRPDVEVVSAVAPSEPARRVSGMQDVEADPVLRAALALLREVLGDELAPPSTPPGPIQSTPPTMLPIEPPPNAEGDERPDDQVEPGEQAPEGEPTPPDEGAAGPDNGDQDAEPTPDDGDRG